MASLAFDPDARVLLERWQEVGAGVAEIKWVSNERLLDELDRFELGSAW